jgi:hypothetical protein
MIDPLDERISDLVSSARDCSCGARNKSATKVMGKALYYVVCARCGSQLTEPAALPPKK